MRVSETKEVQCPFPLQGVQVKDDTGVKRRAAPRPSKLSSLDSAIEHSPLMREEH